MSFNICFMQVYANGDENEENGNSFSDTTIFILHYADGQMPAQNNDDEEYMMRKLHEENS